MKNKQKLQQAPPEVSSIKSIHSESESSRLDIDLEQVNLQLMNHHEYYLGTDVKQLVNIQNDGELYVIELMKRIQVSVFKKTLENELMRKIPQVTADSAIQLIHYPITQQFQQFDDPTRDIESGGLDEDTEPLVINKEQWLTQKINVDYKAMNEMGSYEQLSVTQRVQTASQGFLRSRVFAVSTYTYNKEPIVPKQPKPLEPIPIDLSEPVDISFTEDQMRNEKDRQVKEKQELREAEHRRRLKEQKEEQLKYEMMAKDKKSKQFTYDYDGKLISVVAIKSTKLPVPATTLNTQFIEDLTKLNTKKKYQISQVVTKRKVDDDKDIVKFQALAPSTIDNMALQTGVNIIVDGKLKEGPRPLTVDYDTLTNPNIRMGRNEYLGLTQMATLNRSSTSAILMPKVEDKPIRELDAQTFNYDRLRRLNQSQVGGQGGIKINSTKIMETIAQTIYEEEEQVLIQPKATKPPSQENTFKSPIDKFNMQIYKQQNWGKEQQSGNAGFVEKLKGSKQRDRDIVSSLGQKRNPRSRVVSDGVVLPQIKVTKEITKKKQEIQE